MTQLLKQWLRYLIRPVLYFVYYTPFADRLNVTRSGQPLKKGITAVVAVKNEEYTLPFCLKSLLGFADQVVVIDNGSDDSSLKKAHEFKQRFGNQIEVDIIELPNGLLGDCREAGMKATRYQWHLRWDADMVAKTSGTDDMKLLRKKVLANDTPRAIQLPRINLFGDFNHTLWNPSDPGEPILVWFTKDVFYKEYGKFDAIRVPFYFKQVSEFKNYYFHCAGLKSAENLLHRFHYFTWREWTNATAKNDLPLFMNEIDSFKQRRNQYLFGTTEPLSVRYRFMKQFVSILRKFDAGLYGLYPEILVEEMNNNLRFQVLYENGIPVQRVDKEDKEMMEYQPSAEDKNWDVELFMQKIKKEHFSQYS